MLKERVLRRYLLEIEVKLNDDYVGDMFPEHIRQADILFDNFICNMDEYQTRLGDLMIQFNVKEDESINNCDVHIVEKILLSEDLSMAEKYERIYELYGHIFGGSSELFFVNILFQSASISINKESIPSIYDSNANIYRVRPLDEKGINLLNAFEEVFSTLKTSCQVDKDAIKKEILVQIHNDHSIKFTTAKQLQLDFDKYMKNFCKE